LTLGQAPMSIHLPVARIRPVPTDPDALVLPTLATNTAAHVRGIRTVLKVVSTGGCQCGF
jgi:hypothetical protein